MLEDSLTFQLPSLALLKGDKIPEKKDRSAKCQSMTLLALIFMKSSMYVIKIVKNKNSKTKIVVPFRYSSFTLISTLIFISNNYISKTKFCHE